jgi:hypothetical protein
VAARAASQSARIFSIMSSCSSVVMWWTSWCSGQSQLMCPTGDTGSMTLLQFSTLWEGVCVKGWVLLLGSWALEGLIGEMRRQVRLGRQWSLWPGVLRCSEKLHWQVD